MMPFHWRHSDLRVNRTESHSDNNDTHLIFSALLTNDAKDAQNIRSKYDQQVDDGEQNESDAHVS